MIGCSKVEIFTLTLKWRKKAFLPRIKSVIRSITHPITLGVDLSATVTVSPTVSFLLRRNHFWRSCSKGRYSYFQRPQETYVKYTELVAVFSWNKCCLFVNSPGGREKFWRITYSWAQSSHSGSSDDRKFGSSTQRPLRMNVFAATPGDASSAGLDLLSL